ncbi:MAG: hypothetical protein AAGA75_00725 [Cyanobacteria bacterium P01_E01_bin.6]
MPSRVIIRLPRINTPSKYLDIIKTKTPKPVPPAQRAAQVL